MAFSRKNAQFRRVASGQSIAGRLAHGGRPTKVAMPDARLLGATANESRDHRVVIVA